MTICWERAVPLAFHLWCFNFSAVLVVRVPFPFGVWGRVWNSIYRFLIIAFLSTVMTISLLQVLSFENTQYNIRRQFIDAL